MEDKRREPPPFKLVSGDEEQKLPPTVLRWIADVKNKRGTHQFTYNGRRFLLISSGVRPNPGYRLTLSHVRSGKQGLEVVVRETGPQPGQFYPQVLVVPYLVGEVRGTGTVKVIEESTGKTFGMEADPKDPLR
jgi:PrcB C-terminal